jgi:hypothetical protein
MPAQGKSWTECNPYNYAYISDDKELMECPNCKKEVIPELDMIYVDDMTPLNSDDEGCWCFRCEWCKKLEPKCHKLTKQEEEEKATREMEAKRQFIQVCPDCNFTIHALGAGFG